MTGNSRRLGGQNRVADPNLDGPTKVAAARASESIVSIITYNIPDTAFYRRCRYINEHNDELVLSGTGVIIECQDGGDGRFVSTVLAPATLFDRTNDVQPSQIKVDVYLSDGDLYKGEFLDCDFHYNLAIVSIRSDLPLRTAVLRALDDVSSIDVNEHLQLSEKQSFQLCPHSNLFKILPGTKTVILKRLFEPPSLLVDSGVFRVHSVSHLDCKELYWLEDTKYQGEYGGAVINNLGEVIGIMFYDSPFLPSNLILRWWNHYKCHGGFNRPWLGVEIVNLNAARVEFLDVFRNKFPEISTGIVLTKVEKDTPAYFFGIRPHDVILKCDGKLVRSKMEFFEKIWDNAEKTVDLDILRTDGGCQLNLSLSIGETTPDKFYRWPLPSWEKANNNS